MRGSKIIGLLVLAFVLILLLIRESFREDQSVTLTDGCTACHKAQSDPSPSHLVSVLGCSVCHLGNPFATEKDRAHMGLVINPGDLRTVRLTCGTEKCHPSLPERVEKSLMATNSGILQALQTRWPHNPEESVHTVKQLMSRDPGQSMALDHYRKMCGGCHLWKTRSPRKGEIGKRGGGCTNCHILELEGPKQDLTKKSFLHPKLTTRIPSENCLKCHNRSARTGLSYLGRFESEGYGTPYQGGEPNMRRLTGGRFYLELLPDVHYQKAGMDCIDCHTEKGLMGDGNAYTRMEKQVDITCNSCHNPDLKKLGPVGELADRLIRGNGIELPLNKEEGVLSPKGSPLYHLRVSSDHEILLYRKRDGKEIRFRRLKEGEIHRAAYHHRLSCQACHSAWMPQCYGCHVALLKGEKQKDWLTGERRDGRWVEGRTYLRFQRAPLGIWPNGQIGPFAPGCQIFLDIFDENGKHQPEHSHLSLTMASFDPHTTNTSAPTCMDCHLDPKILGLGDGSLRIAKDGLRFSPIYDSQASGLGLPFPLDAFVSPEGKPLQKTSREESRPFNNEELNRITRVAPCLTCHDRYEDPVYRSFKKSLKRFYDGKSLCMETLP